ncbi:MAG: TonB-dependent receptor plug domain-containing protein, partial [Candidatus Acidiferrales bacterium]
MTARRISAVLLVSFLGLSFISAQAQVTSGTLAGTVLDPNRNALPRVEVRLVNAAGLEVGRALTDSRGQFRFEGLAETSYTITAALVGFGTVSQTAQPGATLEMVLPVAPVREEVVVTATRTEAPTSQLGASTTVLTGEELDTLKTLPLSDALRGVAGTAVVRSGGMGTSTSFFVRGGESDYNKVYLDGVILNEPGGFFDFTNLMAENLERVEVVRGPQSALFGSDAMASVIQIVTRRGQSETRRPHFSFGAEGGNHDTWRARTGVSGAAGILDYSLHWARFSTDNQEPNNIFHNTSLSSNFGLRLGERTTLRLIGRGELGRTGTPGQTAFGRPDLDAFLR